MSSLSQVSQTSGTERILAEALAGVVRIMHVSVDSHFSGRGSRHG
jgi:hypothetical protein